MRVIAVMRAGLTFGFDAGQSAYPPAHPKCRLESPKIRAGCQALETLEVGARYGVHQLPRFIVTPPPTSGSTERNCPSPP